MTDFDVMASQGNYNAEDGNSQIGYAEGTQSMGDMLHQLEINFENEVIYLEQKVVEKSEQLKELDENCSRQSQNIAKQRMDLEHLKIKIENEILNKQSIFQKIRDSREISERVGKYFSEWVNTINQMMVSIANLKELSERNKYKQEQAKKKNILLENDLKNLLIKATQDRAALDLLEEQERKEMNEIRNHLINEIRTEEEKAIVKQTQLQELESKYLEKRTIFKMLTLQNHDLKNTYEELQTEKRAVLEMNKSSLTNLETSLQAAIETGEQLNADIEQFDILTKKTNMCIGDLEVDLQDLKTKQKQLFSEEEENKEILKSIKYTVNELSLDVESLEVQHKTALNMVEENSILKNKFDNLEIINNSYEKRILDLEKEEAKCYENLEDLNQTIINVQNKTDLIINSQLSTKLEIEGLLQKQKDDISEHKQISHDIDQCYKILVEEQDVLNSKLKEITKSIADASNETKIIESEIENLKVELHKLQATQKERIFKFHTDKEESAMVVKDLSEQQHNLDVMLLRGKKDYQQAQSYIDLNLKLKEQIGYLESVLNKHQENYKQIIEELKEKHSHELEAKNKEMEDSRMKHERAFRNKEQIKTDALVELKENRLKITDLEQQEAKVNMEVKVMGKKLVKCDNLIHSLENKLKVVAHVATEISQSVSDAPTQGTNLLDTPNVGKHSSRKMSVLESPGSYCSELMVNPDEFDVKKMKLIPNSYGTKKVQLSTSSFKKKGSFPPVKKESSEDDDWGF